MYSLQVEGLTPCGFPHSEISGSRSVSDSPELIAAVHVLLRLWLPRHPPYALRSLTLSLRHASSSHAGFDSREAHFLFARLAGLLPASSVDSFIVSLQLGRNRSTYSVVNEQCSMRCERRSRWRRRDLRGADRDRTDDLRLAKPALSQLSYSPEVGRWFRAGGPGQS